MRPLSYELVTHAKIHWLDQRFNLVVCYGFQENELELYLQPPGTVERICNKLPQPDMPLLSSRRRRLSGIYKRMLRESFFLHFAGQQDDMTLVR